MGGAGHDDGAFAVKAEFFAECLPLFFRHLCIGLVVLRISGDGATRRIGAHGDDAFHVHLGLHAEFADLEQHAGGEALNEGIATHGAAADAAIHHHDGNFLAPCQAKEIGPKLCLDQDDRLRIHDIHDAFGDDRQIEGEENMAIRFRDDALRHAMPRGGDYGDHHHFLGILFLQLPHDGARRYHLTHRGRMHPDGIVVSDLLQRRRRHDAGTLLQAVVEAFFKHKAVNQNRYL